jgi:hypothetical protein
MSKETYMRGFCKAAEAKGVNPELLLKYAGDGTKMVGQVATELGGNAVRNAALMHMAPGFFAPIAGVSALGDIGGAIAAAITKTRSRGQQKAHDADMSNMAKNLLPGVGSYNFYKRIGSFLNNR